MLLNLKVSLIWSLIYRLGEIWKTFEIPGPPSKLTLYQSDGITEIKVVDSPVKYLKGNTVKNPLIVRSNLIEIGIIQLLVSNRSE